MADETQFLKKPDGSHIFNLSLRGWICIMLVATVCFMSVSDIAVKEPLYTLVGMAMGYYFAQDKKKQSTTTS